MTHADLPDGSAADALSESLGVQLDAAATGFDWTSVEEVMVKLHEEIGELERGIAAGDRASIEEELGDVLFTVVNLSRFVRVGAEDALRGSARRFQERFECLEARLASRGRVLGECSAEELNVLWEEVKRALVEGKNRA